MATRGQDFYTTPSLKTGTLKHITAFSFYTLNPGEDLHTCAPRLIFPVSTFRNSPPTSHTDMLQAICDTTAAQAVPDAACGSGNSDSLLSS